jgi:hypothetical protein
VKNQKLFINLWCLSLLEGLLVRLEEGIGIHIGKGVFVRFGFDTVRISQIQRQVKKQSNQNVSWRVLYTIFGNLFEKKVLAGGLYRLHWRGAFSVARFDLSGNARAFTVWNE